MFLIIGAIGIGLSLAFALDMRRNIDTRNYYNRLVKQGIITQEESDELYDEHKLYFSKSKT